MHQRRDAYRASAIGKKFPASVPWVADDNRLYGQWVLGQDYRSKSGYHGSFPPNYLDRVMALFQDAERVLHLFSGSLPKSDKYTRLDMRDDIDTDVMGKAEECDKIFGAKKRTFDLIHADPPYTEEDAIKYGVPMVNRNKVVEAATKILEPGGYLVWLDMVLPMYAKVDLEFQGQIGLMPVWDDPKITASEVVVPSNVKDLEYAGQVGISRSTNHRYRCATMWKRR